MVKSAKDAEPSVTMSTPLASAPAWASDIARTVQLTRPDIVEMCRGDPDCFAWWLAIQGGREYRGLAEAPPSLPMEHFAAVADMALPGVEPPLSRAMRLTYAQRPDLWPNFDLSSQAGQQGFVWWFLTEAPKELALAGDFALAACHPLLDAPASQALPGVRPVLTRFMALVHAMREDLRTTFDLTDPAGQQAFVWWYFVHGLSEFGFARFVTDEQRRFLNAPEAENGATDALPVTRLMAELRRRRSDLVQAYPLEDEAGRTAFVAWYYAKGLAEQHLLDLLDPAQIAALLAPVPGAPGLPVILAMVWLSSDPDFQSRFPNPAAPVFDAWGRTSDARNAFPILRRLFGHAAISAPAVTSRALPFGVNLIGHARGQFGIGEDVRMAARAMRSASIPFSIYNVDPGSEMCQGDHSVDGLISDARPYAIDLLCTTGIETARLAAVEGSALFDGRRVIGYWPWELAEWPKEWAHAYDLVDEVWASSRHTYEAYVRSCPKTVRHLPMVVTVEETAGLTRRDFGLPENRFLFVFSFDMLSSLARKNPEACVAAFRKAFPTGHEPVGLVVKAMRGASDNVQWLALQRAVAEDGRIHILNRTLDRAQVLDLYRVCDSFVSLHRAEGFGRGIAEAMMLGKPAIVTGYSGNMDFTTPGTAALVGYRMRSVLRGEYPFGEGQLWADPDIDHAAWWMRRLAQDGMCGQKLSDEGSRLTVATFSAESVGRSYQAVLETPSGLHGSPHFCLSRNL